MKNNLPKRKHPRLKEYDYSSTGSYFVTVCTQGRRCVLSRIMEKELGETETKVVDLRSAEAGNFPHCQIEYTKWGKIAEEQLLNLEQRFSCLKVDRYVIMPNHIHVIFVLDGDVLGEKKPYTIMDIVCAYKSLTTLECIKNGFSKKIFQDSFYEHIIRGNEDYEKAVLYICENPLRWHSDKLYANE